jgi:4-nitrophenyl phosphatase
MTGTAQLTQVHNAIIDMDGVLYRGNTPAPGAEDWLEFLDEMDIPFILLTNNSTLTAAQYVTKLAGMGIETERERILTSAEATAMHLARTAPPGATVYAIGEDGVQVELEKRGFVLRESPEVDYVVVGFDRHLTYRKIATASLAIRAGAKFIGTNPDKTFPSELGQMPGNGATLAAIEAASDKAPLIIGKPQPAIFQLALQRLDAEAQSTAMIGDRLDTDILGGHALGLRTILLLSGVTAEEDLTGSSIVPDLVYEDAAALHRAWREAVGPQGRQNSPYLD